MVYCFDNTCNLFIDVSTSIFLIILLKNQLTNNCSNYIIIRNIRKENNTQKMRVDGVKQLGSYYSLDWL